MTRLAAAFGAIFAFVGLAAIPANAQRSPYAQMPNEQMPNAQMPGEQTMNPEQFAKTATISGLYEIKAAQLAERKSPSSDVKQFAQRMVKDHTQLDQKLQSAISEAGIQKPDQKLDSQHQQMINQLEKLKGSSFDRQYITQQVSAHQKAHNLLQQYSSNGESKPLKQWAENGLPTIQEHLQLARTLEKDHNLTASR